MPSLPKSERIQLWLDRLNRFAKSNWITAEFCQLEEFSLPSFYQWKRRLSPRVEPTQPTSARRGTQKTGSVNESNQPSPTFTELVVGSPRQAAACVSLPGGITLTLGDQPEIALLVIDRILQHSADVSGVTVA